MFWDQSWMTKPVPSFGKMDIYWRLEERTWPNLAKSPRSEALILSDGSAAMVPLFHQNMSYNIFFSFDLCKLMVIRHVWTILWTIIRFIWIITKSYSIWPDYAQNIRILCRQRRAQGRYILSRWIKISNFKTNCDRLQRSSVPFHFSSERGTEEYPLRSTLQLKLEINQSSSLWVFI